VESVSVQPRQALLNEQVQVSARLRAGAAPIDGLFVYFYDRSASSRDRAFDVETISHIRADGEYEVRVPFRPTTCGPHSLVVVAHPERAANTTTLEVTVDGAAATHELLLATQGLDLAGPEKRRLLQLLRAAEYAFRKRNIAAALGDLAHFRAWARFSGNALAKELLAQADLIATCIRD
jgi:hypothetical protein